jgi:hypothetical protein
MKLSSEGRVVLELDEGHLKKISNGSEYDFEMLKQVTKTATLMEVACNDHIEIRQMLMDNSKLLVKVATTVGILLALLTGTTVVI